MKVPHLPRPPDMLAILTGGALLLGSAGSVGAQPARQAGPAPVAHSFDELKSRIPRGATVFVTDSAGHEVKGKLGELSDASLSLLVRGKPQIFPRRDVALVRRRQSDSLWNGILIGAAAGAVPAVYWLLADPNECAGSICMNDLLMGVVPGAGIGLGIDAAIRKKVVVYRARSGSPTKTSRTIASTVAHRQGVELSISF